MIEQAILYLDKLKTILYEPQYVPYSFLISSLGNFQISSEYASNTNQYICVQPTNEQDTHFL